MLAWPFEKHLLQLLKLPPGQFRCGAWMEPGLEGFLAAASVSPGPLTDGSRGHAKLTSYFNLSPPLIQQGNPP